MSRDALCSTALPDTPTLPIAPTKAAELGARLYAEPDTERAGAASREAHAIIGAMLDREAWHLLVPFARAWLDVRPFKILCRPPDGGRSLPIPREWIRQRGTLHYRPEPLYFEAAVDLALWLTLRRVGEARPEQFAAFMVDRLMGNAEKQGAIKRAARWLYSGQTLHLRHWAAPTAGLSLVSPWTVYLDAASTYVAVPPGGDMAGLTVASCTGTYGLWHEVEDEDAEAAAKRLCREFREWGVPPDPTARRERRRRSKGSTDTGEYRSENEVALHGTDSEAHAASAGEREAYYEAEWSAYKASNYATLGGFATTPREKAIDAALDEHRRLVPVRDIAKELWPLPEQANIRAGTLREYRRKARYAWKVLRRPETWVRIAGRDCVAPPAVLAALAGALGLSTNRSIYTSLALRWLGGETLEIPRFRDDPKQKLKKDTGPLHWPEWDRRLGRALPSDKDQEVRFRWSAFPDARLAKCLVWRVGERMRHAKILPGKGRTIRTAGGFARWQGITTDEYQDWKYGDSEAWETWKRSEKRGTIRLAPDYGAKIPESDLEGQPGVDGIAWRESAGNLAATIGAPTLEADPGLDDGDPEQHRIVTNEAGEAICAACGSANVSRVDEICYDCEATVSDQELCELSKDEADWKLRWAAVIGWRIRGGKWRPLAPPLPTGPPLPMGHHVPWRYEGEQGLGNGEWSRPHHPSPCRHAFWQEVAFGSGEDSPTGFSE